MDNGLNFGGVGSNPNRYDFLREAGGGKLVEQGSSDQDQAYIAGGFMKKIVGSLAQRALQWAQPAQPTVAEQLLQRGVSAAYKGFHNASLMGRYEKLLRGLCPDLNNADLVAVGADFLEAFIGIEMQGTLKPDTRAVGGDAAGYKTEARRLEALDRGRRAEFGRDVQQRCGGGGGGGGGTPAVAGEPAPITVPPVHDTVLDRPEPKLTEYSPAQEPVTLSMPSISPEDIESPTPAWWLFISGVSVAAADAVLTVLIPGLRSTRVLPFVLDADKKRSSEGLGAL